MNKLMRKNGFSLIEVLVVATIMLVMASIGFVSYQQANKNGRNARRKIDLEDVRQALVLYESVNDTYPTGNGTNAAFVAMIAQISSYLTNTNIQDPTNTGSHVYTYTSATGSTFQVCAYLEVETGSPTYCLNSP